MSRGQRVPRVSRSSSFHLNTIIETFKYLCLFIHTMYTFSLIDLLSINSFKAAMESDRKCLDWNCLWSRLRTKSIQA